MDLWASDKSVYKSELLSPWEMDWDLKLLSRKCASQDIPRKEWLGDTSEPNAAFCKGGSLFLIFLSDAWQASTLVK